MHPFRYTSAVLILGAILLSACAKSESDKQTAPAPKAGPAAQKPSSASASPTPAVAAAGTQAHLDAVMQSAFCAKCHPAIYAEHEENTHGRAFTDAEARIATRGMERADCIRCHTPRPVFETGLGMTPIRRFHGLKDGNSCMTCHWKPDYDYSRFEGGPECKVAFDPRAGTVQLCVTCHRVAGTPEQWSRATNGRLKGNTCMTCHMPEVKRPVAVGQKPRMVHTHLFPGADNETQVRKAYTYSAKIEGDHVVVTISNTGAGHNFNTANTQRSIQSLVIVRDDDGKELYRSRMLFGHAVANPALLRERVLAMPQNTQIPSGQTREHRVPLKVTSGIVECRLYFKRYHPAPDTDPALSLRLEDRKLIFSGVTPSSEKVETSPQAPPAGNPPPPATPEEAANVAGLTKFAYPKPGTKRVAIPEGESRKDIAALIALFEYPVPYAKQVAMKRLVEIGAPAVPQLVETLGHWDNESFNRAMEVLERIGKPAVPALLNALESDQLYVRHHARRVLAALGFPGERSRIVASLRKAFAMSNAVDRWSAAVATGELGDASLAPALEPLLKDRDWDVVAAAATSLAKLRAKAAIPAIEADLDRVEFPETRRQLAEALARLGSPRGIRVLIAELSLPDPLQRERAFQGLFDYAGLYFGYDPDAPEFDRLRGIRKIEDEWARNGGAKRLRLPIEPDAKTAKRAWLLVRRLGGGTDTMPGGDDEKIRTELIGMGEDAVPALVRGLNGFPSGFALKRALICAILGQIGSPRAAPYLAWTLRDPYPAVAAWACWALERAGDTGALGALARYEARLRDEDAKGEISKRDGPVSRLLVQAARTRLLIGDMRARDDLVGYLLSDDLGTRRIAIDGLAPVFHTRRDYDPEAPLKERLKAFRRWQHAE